MFKDKEKSENEKEYTTIELAKLFVELSQMLGREIEIRNQEHEERRLESEQNAYMDKMFTCEFIFSNL